MTDPATLTRDLPTPDATAALAVGLASALSAGDVLLLAGEIGAGKTHFARALIRARLASAGAPPEDIPSPTFTLVQTYAAGPVEIWHADLYRLTDPQEVEELGLLSAFDTALCLVEWPDKLGSIAPRRALYLAFGAVPGGDADSRRMVARGPARLIAALRAAAP